MDVTIRPITDDELEAYCVALEVAFSDRLGEGDLDRERLIAIPDRYLGPSTVLRSWVARRRCPSR